MCLPLLSFYNSCCSTVTAEEQIVVLASNLTTTVAYQSFPCQLKNTVCVNLVFYEILVMFTQVQRKGDRYSIFSSYNNYCLTSTKIVVHNPSHGNIQREAPKDHSGISSDKICNKLHLPLSKYFASIAFFELGQSAMVTKQFFFAKTTYT